MLAIAPFSRLPITAPLLHPIAAPYLLPISALSLRVSISRWHMASITIKDIPAALHERLKVRAARNRRSLNAEVLACLESVVSVERVDPEAELREIAAIREQVGGYLTQALVDESIEEGRRR